MHTLHLIQITCPTAQQYTIISKQIKEAVFIELQVVSRLLSAWQNQAKCNTSYVLYTYYILCSAQVTLILCIICCACLSIIQYCNIGLLNDAICSHIVILWRGSLDYKQRMNFNLIKICMCSF